MKKLNSRGITHLIAPLAIVMLVGVVGTFALVSSHAATPPKNPKKAKALVSVELLNSKANDYHFKATVTSEKTPVTQENCAGTLYVAVIKSGKTTIINTDGSYPTWTGTQCSYSVPLDASYVTQNTNKKGVFKMRVSLNYRGSAVYHQYKKNTTIKTILAGE